jgi:RNA polymerase sigma-70 factor (ECF subfamily)
MQGDTTCWTVIRGAAAGRQKDRDEFARRYGPVLRAYFGARWKSASSRGDVEDGVQDVFVECFRHDGILARADAERAGGFRAFLYGVARNVALRIEARRARLRENAREENVELDGIPASDEGLSRIFDRAWAKALVGEAAAIHAARVTPLGDDAARRVDILRLRFFEGMPIRDIARLWKERPSVVHHQYAQARTEFRRALAEVVAFDHPGTPEDVDARCQGLLGLLGR